MVVRPDPGEWIARARGGDERAWAALYVEFRSNVYRAARRAGLGRADAEDVVQLVLGVYLPTKLERLPKYEGRARFARWLERLAARQAHDMRRRRRRLALLHKAAVTGVVDWSPAEHDLAVDEAFARVESHLTKTLWEPLALRELRGLSYAEIADALGISEECVRKRLYRARVRLRSLRAAAV